MPCRVLSALREPPEDFFGYFRGEPSQFFRQPNPSPMRFPSCDSIHQNKAGSGFVAVAYNPLAQSRSGYVDVPISWPEAVVTDAAGEAVEAQVLPFRHKNLLPPSPLHPSSGGGGGGEGRRSDQHPYTLVLPVESAGPLEATVFQVSRKAEEDSEGRDGDGGAGGGTSTSGERGTRRRQRHYGGGKEGSNTAAAAEESFTISSDLVTLTFDGATGRLSRMETVLAAGGGEEGGGGSSSAEPATVALDVDQGWFYYPTFDDGETGGDAGAGGRRLHEQHRQQQQRQHQQHVFSETSAAVEASRLHGELRERLSASQGQKGGAYIFRPEGEGRGGAKPVGVVAAAAAAAAEEEGGGETEEDPRAVREWWVEEGPIVSEVHQVRRIGHQFRSFGFVVWSQWPVPLCSWHPSQGLQRFSGSPRAATSPSPAPP